MNKDGLYRINQSAEQKEWGSEVRDYLVSHENGRINLANQLSFQVHRSGWSYVLNLLEKLNNKKGIMFAGYLEHIFLWNEDTFLKTGLLPLKKPWVGIIHNPPGIPSWFCSADSPVNLIRKNSFRQSLDTCLGFFALSEYMADFLRRELGKPVSVVYHPTEPAGLKFNFDKFLKNREKKIISVGWWLRRLNSIFLLPLEAASGCRKIRLVGYKAQSGAAEFVEQLRLTELQQNQLKAAEIHLQNTDTWYNLDNDAYDGLLSENIVLLDLYDSSANNTLVECMARNTPVLVPPLPAVKEYLGAAYPLYFSTLEEAAEKARDHQQIKAAWEYLQESGATEKITAPFFYNSFINSAVYRSIPAPD